MNVIKPEYSDDLQSPLTEKMDKFVIGDHSRVRNTNTHYRIKEIEVVDGVMAGGWEGYARPQSKPRLEIAKGVRARSKSSCHD